jgi:hypothetical protein
MLKGNVTIGEAVCNENGKATGGKAGDQTGRELRFSTLQKNFKFTYGYRFIDEKAADLCVRKLVKLINSRCCGYSQTLNKRTSLADELMKYNWNVGKMIKDGAKVEADCSSLAACMVKALQAKFGQSYNISKNAYSGDLGDLLMRTGKFIRIDINAVKTGRMSLKKGDILIRPYRHVAIVVSV